MLLKVLLVTKRRTEIVIYTTKGGMVIAVSLISVYHSTKPRYKVDS